MFKIHDPILDKWFFILFKFFYGRLLVNSYAYESGLKWSIGNIRTGSGWDQQY